MTSPLLIRFSRYIPLMVLIFIGWAAASFGAPPFVFNGRFEELGSLILAEDETGPVTALDLILYLDMARNVIAEMDAETWLEPEGERDPALTSIIQGALYQYLTARSLARKGSASSVPAFQRRAMLYSAAEAAWTQTTVIPEVHVDTTDVQRNYITHAAEFKGSRRAQVRYIFLGVDEMVEIGAVRDAEIRLGEIRDRIIRGEISFAEAARQYSQAPSARQEGLIPEFEQGAHFRDFDFEAFDLKRPGDLSPVFAGNEGVYLIQLVSRSEPRPVPIDEVEAQIRKRLRYEHIRPYYRLLLGKLKSKYFIRNLAPLWQYANLDAPIAILGDLRLGRDELMRINPKIVNAGYEVQWGVLLRESKAWIEGEIVMRDLESRALAGHRILDRAGRVADQLLAARSWLIQNVPLENVSSIEAAIRTLDANQQSEHPSVPQARAIRIIVSPDSEAIDDLARRELARKTVRELGLEISQGFLPLGEGRMNFARVLTQAAEQGDEALEQSLSRIEEQLEPSPWADVRIELEDLGWKDAMASIAWHEGLVFLQSGQLSRAYSIGEDFEFFLAAQTRLDENSPWLEAPLVLQTAAFELEKGRLFLEELERVRSRITTRTLAGN